MRLNNAANDFQFAIVSDRTGGHREKIFSKAVEQLNLLQPEFVVSVGDLIEGYTSNKQQITREWREFQTFVARLQMPFFYVAGHNHDLTNKTQAEMWKEKFGRTYYKFVYRDVLFVMLDSEDPPGNDYGMISQDQVDWLEKTLAAHPKPRWTMVFLHKPMWIMPTLEKNGWLKVEKVLAGRPCTVFAGHVHRYQKFTRQGHNYCTCWRPPAAKQQDARGRIRGVRSPGLGDHEEGRPGLRQHPARWHLVRRHSQPHHVLDEEGDKEYYLRPTHPVTMKVTLDGKPIPGCRSLHYGGKGKEPRQPYADGNGRGRRQRATEYLFCFRWGAGG